MTILSRLLSVLGLVALLFTPLAAPAADDLIHGEGLLFKVTRAGTEPSWVFGTMHTEDPRVLRLAEPVEAAFRRADRLVMEMEPDSEALTYIRNHMFYRDGRTLREVIGADLYARTVEAMADYGVKEEVVRQLKPWVVMTTLSGPKDDSDDYLDQRLYQRAVSDNMAVTSLETAPEQVAVLDGMAEADQVGLLRQALHNLDTLEESFERMVRTYIDRDLAGLLELNDAYLSEADRHLVAVFNRRVIFDRNHRMAERLMPVLREGRAFVAIGALHLPGRDGVLRLLEQRGYGVERVY